MANRTREQQPHDDTQNTLRPFKLVLLGLQGVGKSSLLLRFVKGEFFLEQNTTIGAAFMDTTVCIDDTVMKFDIWDTAGAERFQGLTPLYYRDAQAAIVVYDIQNLKSFATAQSWVEKLRQEALPNIVIALAGNKADLANYRKVDYQEAEKYADENGLLFMETSAKTAVNVNDIFLAIAKKLPKHVTAKQTVVLTQNGRRNKRSCCN